MAPISAKKQLLFEVLAVAAAVAVFYGLYFDPTHMQSGGDYANLFWPMKEFRTETLLGQRVFALWNPYIFFGAPAAATLQHAIFYPVDYVFFWFSPLLGEMNLYNLFHLILCGVGAWWWMRFALRSGTAGAILAGAAFPCTAWFWGAQEHINQIAAVAWMPWMLGAAWMLAAGRMSAVRFVVVYTGLGAMQFLVGHPQAAFYTHGAAAAILAIGSVAFGGEGRLRRLGVAVLCFGAAGILTMLLTGVQLLPGLELTPLASRHQFDPPWSFRYSMPPDILLTYFQPHRFGSYVAGYQDMRAYNEYGVFVGLPILILAIGEVAFQLWRLVAPGRKARRAPLLLAVAIVVTLLMAMGGNVSLSRILHADFTEFPMPARLDPKHGISLHDIYVALFPPAAGFRVPARIIVITALAWTSLAGLALDRILRELRHREQANNLIIGVAGGAIAIAWCGLYLPARAEKFNYPVETAPLLLAWGEDVDLHPGKTIDNRLFRLTINDDAFLKANRQLDTEPIENTVWLRWMRLFENDNVVLHYPSAAGYEEGLAPTIRTKDFLLRFNRHFRQFRPDQQLLALLGIGRIFSDLPIDIEALQELPVDLRRTRALFGVPGAGGAAFWAEQAEGIDLTEFDGPHQLAGEPPLTGYQDDKVDYGKAVQWDRGLPVLTTDVSNPNRVVVESTGPIPGDAILSMGQYPGWTIAGEPVEWLNAVHARVPASAFVDGRAVLEFRPESHRVGLFLTGIGLGIWFAGLSVITLRRKIVP
ncbi:hypothetical protein KQI84_10065 [bacterium]|nr:hypothetical protein [bacterium]